jgi:hypothetical protein
MASWEDVEVNPFLLSAASPIINEQAALSAGAAAAATGTAAKASRGRVPSAGRGPGGGRGRGRGTGGIAPQPSSRRSAPGARPVASFGPGPAARRAPKDQTGAAAVEPPSLKPPLLATSGSGGFEERGLRREADARTVYRRHHQGDVTGGPALSAQVGCALGGRETGTQRDGQQELWSVAGEVS